MKILILYASAGAGHRKAAEAVYEALSEKIGKPNLVLADALAHTTAIFRWLYSKKYLTLVNYMPLLWGFFYYLLDNKWIYRLVRIPRRIVNGLNCRRLERFILQEKPDVVVSAHFMTNEVMGHMKRSGRLNCRLFCAVTDYRLHSFWVVPEVQQYFVAAQKTKEDLLRAGVAESRIHITGIPISPKFSLLLHKDLTRIKLGLNPNLLTVLIIGGGFGVGPVEELVRRIGAVSADMQLAVVCGWNKELEERVAKTVAALGLKAKVYGFVDNIHELMSASDILVTKSGGLTSSEALAKGLPAIFVKPIPGQETRNSRVLEAAGAAFIASGALAARDKIKEWISQPAVLNEIRESVKKTAHPRSAGDVADLVLRFASD
jgi:processive 1,2-diacylglycerol beta-glucosyltransferase